MWLHRIPDWLLRRMLLNNAVSAAVGFIPFVGDVVLAMYKANSRNAALLEEFLRIRGEEFLKAAAQRTEDPENVRPGAGREPDEVVPGKKPDRTASALSTASGWFRRGSKGKAKKKAKGEDREDATREELAGALAKGWAAWDFGQRYHDAFGARSFGLIGLGVVCEMLERLEKLDSEAQDVDEGPGSA